MKKIIGLLSFAIMAACASTKNEGSDRTISSDVAKGRVQVEINNFENKIQSMKEQHSGTQEDLKTVEGVSARVREMVEVDQFVRKYLRESLPKDLMAEERKQFSEAWVKRMGEIDQENLLELKLLLKDREWFVISKYGEITDSNAYLFDRVASSFNDPSKRKLQRYGTQGACTGPGTWEPWPVENPKNLDKLRASVDLGSMSEYKMMFKDICTEDQRQR